jgi:hypothetical protein
MGGKVHILISALPTVRTCRSVPLRSDEVPRLREIAGGDLFEKLAEQVKDWHLRRVESDLSVVQRFLSDAEILRHYLRPLLNDKVSTVAELFAVARAASRSLELVPHAPGQGSKNVDARLTLPSGYVALEVKHQRDTFPFSDRVVSTDPDTPLHVGLRPGADLRFLDLPPLQGATKQVPGADVWRATLLEAASQLPLDMPGVIAVSVDAFGSDLIDDIRSALYGDEVVLATPTESTGSTFRTARVPNGAFAQSEFSHVAEVWFFRLQPTPVREAGDHETMCEWAHGASNPQTKWGTLPDALAYAFPEVFGRSI